MKNHDHREGNYQLHKAELFVLVGSQRSGTNFFREVVATHDQIAVHGEILWPYPLPIVWHNYVRYMISRAYPPLLDTDAVALIDDYFVYLAEETRRSYPNKADGLAAIGVDIKYNQLRFLQPLIQDLQAPPFFLEYCRRRQMRIVHVFRRNVVHQALSLAIAEARNVYHNYDNKQFAGSLAVDPHKVTDLCWWVLEQQDAFRTLTKDLPVHEVCYEDLAAVCKAARPGTAIPSTDLTMTGIANFLKVPCEFKSPSSISKVINRPYREILTNHSAIVDHLRTKSRFASLAQEL